MLKRIAIAAALAAVTVSGWAGTVIGGATLLDTATVLPGTVTPTTFLTYVSGGNGETGNADGSTYNILTGSLSPAAAMASADHQWAQFEAPILMHSNTALSDVIAIPAIDHGWTAGNTNEFWESFEFIVWGCAGTIFSNTACEEGHITKVWTLGVDNGGAGKNADDWTTQWHFNGGYNNFFVTSGDRLDHGNGARGAFSPGEGEIDALAAAPIPEPETYALFAAGLAVLGFVSRRQRRRS
jgi:hypothetical protein